jgi:hypothetical protein
VIFAADGAVFKHLAQNQKVRQNRERASRKHKFFESSFFYNKKLYMENE